jgi:UDP-N-acetylmuramoyl-L-alanyl-D-glutamate--2,6-diaminopimelate ligase
MILSQVVEDLGVSARADTPGIEIRDLAYDSRKVGSGSLFFCVPGEKSDGHDFAADAVAAGAAALVCERPLGLGVAEVEVPDARAAMAPAAARFFGQPSQELGVAAVTGTNGKTTTAWLLREILAAAAGPCGLIGTVTRIVAGQAEEAARTTPEAIDLQRDFRRMLEGGDRNCVIEASSHALELHRCDATRFRAAIFTNLTQDHLDFHPDMEAYFQAKRRLFELAPKVAVINLDDEYGRRLAKEFGGLTYSADGNPAADLRAEQVEFDAGGTRFTLAGSEAQGGGELEVRIGLPGHFNVANALAAIGAATRMGVDMAAAVEALAGASQVPGRFEAIDRGQDFTVLVDYAHTPDSLENVLKAARRLTAARVISVFGAGGDRDRDKRPKMGRAGALGSDLVYITSDNPRSEPPEQILEQVLAGAREGEAQVEAIVDRREAIASAIAAARPGDVVVIAGKGHEQGQEFADGHKIPFDDRQVAAEILEGLKVAGGDVSP